MHRSPRLNITIPTKTCFGKPNILAFSFGVICVACSDATGVSCLFTGLIVAPQTVACRKSPPAKSSAPCHPNVSMRQRKTGGMLKYAMLAPLMNIALANERLLSKYCWMTTFAASLLAARLIPVDNGVILRGVDIGFVLVGLYPGSLIRNDYLDALSMYCLWKCEEDLNSLMPSDAYIYTYKCVSKLTIIGLNNGLSPCRLVGIKLLSEPMLQFC